MNITTKINNGGARLTRLYALHNNRDKYIFKYIKLTHHSTSIPLFQVAFLYFLFCDLYNALRNP